MKIRPYIPSDWPVVEDIYWQGIKTGIATFDMQPKSQREWEDGSLDGSPIVALSEEGDIIAWACLWPTSKRACYSGVAEISVYVGESARGKGVGTKMLLAMNELSEDMGIWTLQAAITKENEASVICHERAGYKILGLRDRIAQREGKWYSSYIMERRSEKGVFE